jgi:hypothetical protein
VQSTRPFVFIAAFANEWQDGENHSVVLWRFFGESKMVEIDTKKSGPYIDALANWAAARSGECSSIPGTRKEFDGIVAKRSKGTMEYRPQNFVGVRTCAPAEVRKIDGRWVAVRV